jgi:DNA-binding CsgD family transcriptional regulator
MTDYIELAGWRVQLANRLTAKEGEAVALAAAGNTAKESARALGVSQDTVKDRWLNARDKFGYIGSLRELLVHMALKGLIAPLCLMLTLAGPFQQQTQPVRRPEAPRSAQMVRVQRIEFTYLAA